MFTCFSAPSLPRTLAAIAAAVLLPMPANAQSPSFRDLSIQQRPVAELNVPEGDLKISAWVDRKDDTYRAGDAVQLFVKSNRDAYITVIDVGTSGKVHVLFPNKHQTDNRIMAHQVLQVPGTDAPYRIAVGGPAGHELIKIVATTRPDAIIDPQRLSELGPFRSYQGTAETLTRDLGIELEQRHRPGPQAGAATFNKVIRIMADGAGLPRPPVLGGATPPAKVSAEDLFRLGEAAFYGDTPGSSYREALRYYTAAAEVGHVGAMVRIARIHEQGLDVDRDLAMAVRWYRRAAELGSTQAMVRIAMLLAEKGPNRDIPAAVGWLKKAAGQGDGVAMTNLAKLHDEGIGVEKSPREAANFMLAALKAGAWIVIDQAPKMSAETRREMQKILKTAGLYKGAVDGEIGAETRAAMLEFSKVA